jgi:hypothetical protein
LNGRDWHVLAKVDPDDINRFAARAIWWMSREYATGQLREASLLAKFMILSNIIDGF